MPVYGPYFDKASGRWRVRFTDESGKARSKSFPDEETARSFMAELDPPRERPASPRKAAAPLPGVPGDAQWWRAVLSRHAERLIGAQEEGSPELRDLQASGRVLASLALSSGKHSTDADILRRLDELEGTEQEIKSAKRYGPKRGGSPKPTKHAPVPGTPLD